ncbi:MAG TPA: hypothetical protein VJT67_05740 [Longimicrobiaceae bacterium]|nr:hypothetical protein [Longimicrobiaceae bacterium]
MPSCPPITFEGVTPEVWDCLKSRARGIGIPLDENGSASAQGVTVEYERDAAANSLTVTITSMPQGGDCGAAERKLRDAAGVCGAR